MTKGERREAKRRKAQHGMRVAGRSILLLWELSVTPKAKKEKRK